MAGEEKVPRAWPAKESSAEPATWTSAATIPAQGRVFTTHVWFFRSERPERKTGAAAAPPRRPRRPKKAFTLHHAPAPQEPGQQGRGSRGRERRGGGSARPKTFLSKHRCLQAYTECISSLAFADHVPSPPSLGIPKAAPPTRGVTLGQPREGAGLPRTSSRPPRDTHLAPPPSCSRHAPASLRPASSLSPERLSPPLPLTPDKQRARTGRGQKGGEGEKMKVSSPGSDELTKQPP